MTITTPSTTSPLIGNVSMQVKKGDGPALYALSLPRRGPAAELNYGDDVEMFVSILTPIGLQYYSGVLRGRVVRVSARRVRIYIPVEYRPVIELAYQQKWPVLVYSITKKSSGGT